MWACFVYFPDIDVQFGALDFGSEETFDSISDKFQSSSLGKTFFQSLQLFVQQFQQQYRLFCPCNNNNKIITNINSHR